MKESIVRRERKEQDCVNVMFTTEEKHFQRNPRSILSPSCCHDLCNARMRNLPARAHDVFHKSAAPEIES